MSKPERKPILNADLPPQFRQIRIVLAREPGHPDGDDEVAYIFVAPVDNEGRIDPKLWQSHSEACRIARQRPNEADQLGNLVHQAGGAWWVPLSRRRQSARRRWLSFRGRTLRGRRVCLDQRARQDAYLPRDDGVASLARA